MKLLIQNNKVSDNEVAKTIVKDLNLAKNGINNLKTTYSDDTYFCCEVDTYVETMTAKLMDLKATNPDLFKVEDEKKPQPPLVRPSEKKIK